MTLIHTGSYSFEKNEITFESVKNAFFLFSQISFEHVHSLDTIANELIDFHNDLKTNNAVFRLLITNGKYPRYLPSARFLRNGMSNVRAFHSGLNVLSDNLGYLFYPAAHR